MDDLGETHYIFTMNATRRPADIARRAARALAGRAGERDSFRRETFATRQDSIWVM